MEKSRLKLNNLWPENPEYIYIHWPFCSNKCDFCAHPSLPKTNQELEKRYHNALCGEIKRYFEDYSKYTGLNKKLPIKAIFLGGGTSSSYPPYLLRDLFDLLNRGFDLKRVKEVTIEVYPKGINEELLREWRKIGINRISIGVQILNDKILEDFNRRQKKEDVFKIIEMTQKYFNNISVDLMLGLPGTNENIWQNTLNTVVSWPINHISIFLLKVSERTPLFRDIKNKRIKLINDHEVISMYNKTVKSLDKHGFKQYELGQFAKQGYMSLYNQACWDISRIKGFGMAAGSSDGFSWLSNEKNLIKYLKDCKENNGRVNCSEEKIQYREPKIFGILKRKLEKKLLIQFYSPYYNVPLLYRLKNIIWHIKR